MASDKNTLPNADKAAAATADAKDVGQPNKALVDYGPDALHPAETRQQKPGPEPSKPQDSPEMLAHRQRLRDMQDQARKKSAAGPAADYMDALAQIAAGRQFLVEQGFGAHDASELALKVYAHCDK